MNRRLPFSLLRMLVAVLLLQTVLAPAVCLAAAGGSGGLAMEICTADGMQTVQQAADDAAGHGESNHGGTCLICHALPHGAVLAVPALPVPAWLGVPQAVAPAEAAASPQGIRCPSGGARAPPAFS